MRWFLGIFAFMSIIAGLVLFNAAQHRQADNYTALQSRYGEVLLRANRSADALFEHLVLQAEQNTQSALERAHKSEVVDSDLLVLGQPKFILSDHHQIRAPDFLPSEDFLAGAEASLGTSDALSLFLEDSKHYLFLSGKTTMGERFLSAFDPETFFSSLQTTDGTVHWIALKNGTILYHPQSRYLGESAVNLKPIAAAIKTLSEGRHSALVSSYEGLDGNQTLGAWGTVPKYHLVLGSEWPKFSAHLDPSGEVVAWGMLLFSALGFFLLGRFTKRVPKHTQSEPLFDTARLDADALEFLEKARESSEAAIRLAKEKEDLAQKLENSLRKQLLLAKEADWKLHALDDLYKAVASADTGKEVWLELAKIISDHLPGAQVIYYRFSQTSFSLVPEFALGLDSLEESAAHYLNDARIFIGQFSKIKEIESTEAYQKWELQRTHHMHVKSVNTHFLTIDCGAALRGAIMILSRPENSVNEETLAFFLELVRRASWLYDLPSRLVQSKHAKRDRGPTLASTTNDPRDRPATIETKLRDFS